MKKTNKISFSALVSQLENTFEALCFDDVLSIAFDLISVGTSRYTASADMAEKIDEFAKGVM